jgi:hypothetical protein
MSNSKHEDLDKDIVTIQQNQQDEYWSKKYGVSHDELKKSRKNIGISAKIIEAAFKKKSLSV